MWMNSFKFKDIYVELVKKIVEVMLVVGSD